MPSFPPFPPSPFTTIRRGTANPFNTYVKHINYSKLSPSFITRPHFLYLSLLSLLLHLLLLPYSTSSPSSSPSGTRIQTVKPQHKHPLQPMESILRETLYLVFTLQPEVLLSLPLSSRSFSFSNYTQESPWHTWACRLIIYLSFRSPLVTSVVWTQVKRYCSSPYIAFLLSLIIQLVEVLTDAPGWIRQWSCFLNPQYRLRKG